MVLSDSTWQDVEAFSREAVVLIPTGAVEQHGPHLPLVTDTLLVEEIAKGVEKRNSDLVLLCPAIWLGISVNHISYAGTLSATFDSYSASLAALIGSLQRHRFRKFYVLNGHGGNSDSNRIALRRAKELSPNDAYAHASYFELIEEEIAGVLQGPSKRMTHGCEAETSLVLHLRPELVKRDKFRKDGMKAEPAIRGLVNSFEELSEEGSIGYPGFGSAATGAKLFETAVGAVSEQISRMSQTVVMVEI